MSHTSIDAVITWVDGSDPNHQLSLAATLKKLGRPAPSSVTGSRLSDMGELEYCVVSLLRYAPWIRYIYIVTDNQIPPVVQKLQGTDYAGRVHVVDHRDIFAGYDQYLPTFNIRSIMTLLYRIPGLADQFIFFNDDFALLKPVQPTDFFREGKVVLRGEWKKLPKENSLLRRFRRWRRIKSGKRVASGHIAAQEASARAAGLEHLYLRIPHTPHPWLKHHFAAFIETDKQRLQANIQYPFRDPAQLISECLAAYVEIKQGNALHDKQLKTLQLKPADQADYRLRSRMFYADLRTSVAFVCVQGLASAPAHKQQLITRWLDKRIGRLEQFLAQPNPLLQREGQVTGAPEQNPRPPHSL